MKYFITSCFLGLGLGFASVVAQGGDLDLTASNTSPVSGEIVKFSVNVSSNVTKSVSLIQFKGSSKFGRTVGAPLTAKPYEWNLPFSTKVSGLRKYKAVSVINSIHVFSNELEILIKPANASVKNIVFESTEKKILSQGKTLQLHVLGLFTDGKRYDVTHGGMGTVYSENMVTGVKVISGDSPVIDISTDGILSAKKIGEAEVVATNNGKVAIRRIKVVAAPTLPNQPPIAIDDTATTKQDISVKTVNVLSNDTDADNDALTVSVADTASAQGGTIINHNDGTFTYTPKAGFTGTDTFEYTVSDGKGGTDIGTVTITVEKVVDNNNPPKAANDSFALDKNTTAKTGNVLANDTDKDGDTLTITAFDALSKEGGKVVNNKDGTFTYTPKKDYFGSDSFTYTVSDGKGGTDIGTVNIKVKDTCFIATAAFGSYLAPDVKVLRDFRDHYLLTNDLGKNFVAFYYATSPPVANYIAERDSLRVVTRWALTPIIYSIKYPAGALLFILLLIVGWKKRHLLLSKRLTQA